MIDLNDVAGTAFRLLPLVYANVGASLPDDALKARLRGIARHAWLRSRVRWHLCTASIDRLKQSQIPFMLIKGTALVVLLGAVADLRVQADCDVLVPRDHAPGAVKIMLDLGLSCWRLEHGLLPSGDFDLIHGLDFTQPGNAIGLVDLHWRPLVEVESEELTNEFFARSAPALLSGRDVRAPSIEDALLQTVIHGSKYDEPPRFDWMADCVLMMRVVGERIDWRRLWATSDRYGLAGILEDSLDLLSDTVLLPIPSSAWRRRVGRISALERREARARSTRPAARSRSDWLILDLQKMRRADIRLSAQALEACLPALLGCLRAPKLPEQAGLELAAKADPLWFVSGWSLAERHGRWTDGVFAVLAVRAPSETSRRLHLRTLANAQADRPPPSAAIYVGGRQWARLRWPEGTKSVVHDVLDLTGVETDDGWIVLQFRIADPFIPARFDERGDPRRLGFLLISAIWAEVSAEVAGSSRPRLASDWEGGDDAIRFLDGWSVREPSGRWTDGESAFMAVRAPGEATAFRFGLLSVASGTKAHPVQSADVFVADRFVARLRWPLGPHRRHRHLLAFRQEDAVDNQVLLRFRIAHPQVPTDAAGGDRRRLGIFLLATWRATPFRSIAEAAIDLRFGSPDRNLLLHGWDEAPEKGCWTEGRTAALRWDGDLPAGAELEVEVGGCFCPDEFELSGRVYLNDHLAGRFAFQQTNPMPTRLRLAASASPAALGWTELRFEFDQACSPASVGLSGDVRELGMIVRTIALARGAASVEAPLEREKLLVAGLVATDSADIPSV